MEETVAVVEASLANDFHAFVTSELRKSVASNNEKLLDCTEKLTSWLKSADNRLKCNLYIVGCVISYVL